MFWLGNVQVMALEKGSHTKKQTNSGRGCSIEGEKTGEINVCARRRAARGDQERAREAAQVGGREAFGKCGVTGELSVFLKTEAPQGFLKLKLPAHEKHTDMEKETRGGRRAQRGSPRFL